VFDAARWTCQDALTLPGEIFIGESMRLLKKIENPDGGWSIFDGRSVRVAFTSEEWMADLILSSVEGQRRIELLKLENVAAISAEFHSHPKRYKKFYAKNADELSGFPGIWMLMIDAAVAFTRAEPDDWESDEVARDHIDAVTLFAERLATDEVGFDEESLYRLARDCIYGPPQIGRF
jgi:hypothetical protein